MSYRKPVYTFGMSRLRRLHESRRIFFITTHFERTAAPVTEAERNIILQSMMQARANRHFLLLAYCLMPTHLHLLLIPPESDTMGNAMREIKIRSSKQLSAMRGRHGKLWQARSFDRIMRNRKELSETIDYIHQNPVKDGLAKAPGDWKWSSWTAWQKCGDAVIPIDIIDLPADEEAPLRW
ncbi:MAG: REP-associated tyrosine transposase [Candidatus Acidiferrales bacterium]